MAPLRGHCISYPAVQTYTEDAHTILLTASPPRTLTLANSSKTLPLTAQFPVKAEGETLTIALLWLNIYLALKLVTLMNRFDPNTSAEKLHIRE